MYHTLREFYLLRRDLTLLNLCTHIRAKFSGEVETVSKPLKDEAFKVFGTHPQAVFNGVSCICKGGSAVLHCFSLEMVDSIGCEHDFVSH